MEFLATFGLAAKELFDYNRENYSFDAEQRLQRELMRLDMQVTRFEMFREDIRDLVELTVGKMEMYHLVGALFLEKTVALYCEGRIKEEVPPFLLALYYMSVAAGYAYLVLAVWLSMYASICSHSFGVRLLTRFVRLPIPGARQLDSINARLGDFEQQGAQAMRVPFVGGRQEWKRRQNLGAVPEEDAAPAPGGAAASSSSSNAAPPQARAAPTVQEDFLGPGELPLGAMEGIMKASTQLPGKHVHLYRRLQNKWQCYDAYARVSMALGTNCILLAFTFYLVDVCLVQFNAPSAAYSLILVFQFTALALCYIDVAKVGHITILFMQALPCSAAFIAAISAERTDHADGRTESEGDAGEISAEQLSTKYPLSPLCFFLLAAWFEMLLRTAWPSSDGACLPRRFRAVLFLDVFEDGGLNVEEAEGQVGSSLFGDGAAAFGQRLASSVIGAGVAPRPGVIGRAMSGDMGGGSRRKPLVTVKLARDADDALFTAHAAVRRWEAVPAGLSDAQKREVAELRQEINVWRNALNAEAARRAGKRGIPNAAELLVLDERPWNELSEQEQEEDPHAHALIGPLQHTDSSRGTSTFYFDVEAYNFAYRVPEGTPTFTLQDVHEYVKIAEEQVRALLEGGQQHHHTTGSSTEESLMTSEEETADEGAAFGLPFRMQGGITRRNSTSALGGTYIPPRMPWRILNFMTRGLQVAYLFLGIAYVFQNTDVVVLDVTSYIRAEERRLSVGVSPGESLLEKMAVEFPQGAFYQPRSLSCLSDGSLLVGSRHELHLASLAEAGRPTITQALDEDRFPHDAVAMCSFSSLTAAGDIDDVTAAQPERLSRSCMMGALVDGGSGVALWPMGGLRSEAKTLPISAARPWSALAGAVVPCFEVETMLEPQENGGLLPADACLLLAGFDGARVPMAAVELERGGGATGGGHALAIRAPVSEVVPAFDFSPPRKVAPRSATKLPGQALTPWRGRRTPPGASTTMTTTSSAQTAASCPAEGQRSAAAATETVLDLHIEALPSGVGPRVWALLGDGSVQVWDVARPRRLGRWTPSWPRPGPPGAALEAAAMCVTEAGEVHFVAYNTRVGPRWYRSAVTSTQIAEAAAAAVSAKQIGSPAARG